MAIRSTDNIQIIESFEGVNDAIDRIKLPSELVPTSLGGWYTEKNEFERIKGKRLVTSSSTNLGSILCIKQLEFKNEKVVVYHSSTGYFKAASGAMITLLSTTSSINPLGTLVL